jgi:hypothetical protein
VVNASGGRVRDATRMRTTVAPAARGDRPTRNRLGAAVRRPGGCSTARRPTCGGAASTGRPKPLAERAMTMTESTRGPDDRRRPGALTRTYVILAAEMPADLGICQS